MVAEEVSLSRPLKQESRALDRIPVHLRQAGPLNRIPEEDEHCRDTASAQWTSRVENDQEEQFARKALFAEVANHNYYSTDCPH